MKERKKKQIFNQATACRPIKFAELKSWVRICQAFAYDYLFAFFIGYLSISFGFQLVHLCAMLNAMCVIASFFLQ